MPAAGGAGGTPTGGAGGKGGSGGMVGGGPSIKIDSGSLVAAGAWAADTDFAPTPGAVKTYGVTCDVSKVTNPAPAAVYQTDRWTNYTYTVPGYKAGTLHTLRLHFCETYFPPPGSAVPGTGSRLCNITINGTAALPNYDIFAASGGKNIAVVEQLVLAADAGGNYVMAFVPVKDQCLLAGIEID